MKDQILTSIIVVVFIICLFLAWYFTHKARHRERLLIIEKGLPMHELQSTTKDKVPILVKLGQVLFGLSIGLVVVHILGEFGALKGDLIPLAILGIFGGGALMINGRLKRGK